jgi:hypothetical protein
MMQISLDVVDLLQLREVWIRLPIIVAYSRLAERTGAMADPTVFAVDELVVRLARLRHSVVWLADPATRGSDPARLPFADLTDEYLAELFPEAESPAAQRWNLFQAIYKRFVVAYCRDSSAMTIDAFRLLARVRQFDFHEVVDSSLLPREGSLEWIPAEIADPIRRLDRRYQADEEESPATYVVSDDFWPLIAKSTAEDIAAATALWHDPADDQRAPRMQDMLTRLVDVAVMWQRSPSVVGLCYQLAE